MTCSESKRINNAKKFPYLAEMYPHDREDYLLGKYTKADKLRFLCNVCGAYYEQSPKERQKKDMGTRLVPTKRVVYHKE